MVAATKELDFRAELASLVTNLRKLKRLYQGDPRAFKPYRLSGVMAQALRLERSAPRSAGLFVGDARGSIDSATVYIADGGVPVESVLRKFDEAINGFLVAGRHVAKSTNLVVKAAKIRGMKQIHPRSPQALADVRRILTAIQRADDENPAQFRRLISALKQIQQRVNATHAQEFNQAIYYLANAESAARGGSTAQVVEWRRATVNNLQDIVEDFTGRSAQRSKATQNDDAHDLMRRQLDSWGFSASEGFWEHSPGRFSLRETFQGGGERHARSYANRLIKRLATIGATNIRLQMQKAYHGRVDVDGWTFIVQWNWLPRSKSAKAVKGSNAQAILKAAGVKPSAHQDDLRYAMNRLPGDANRAYYGIEYARHRAVISGTAEMNIRALNAGKMAQLIAEIIRRGINQNDTGRFLNERFDPDYRRLAGKSAKRRYRQPDDQWAVYAVDAFTRRLIGGSLHYASTRREALAMQEQLERDMPSDHIVIKPLPGGGLRSKSRQVKRIKASPYQQLGNIRRTLGGFIQTIQSGQMPPKGDLLRASEQLLQLAQTSRGLLPAEAARYAGRAEEQLNGVYKILYRGVRAPGDVLAVSENWLRAAVEDLNRALQSQRGAKARDARWEEGKSTLGWIIRHAQALTPANHTQQGDRYHEMRVMLRELRRNPAVGGQDHILQRMYKVVGELEDGVTPKPRIGAAISELQMNADTLRRYFLSGGN